jgi:hypothetical protein
MTSSVTPRGLLAVALFGCLVAAMFGAAPLAAWANGFDPTVLGPAADAWQNAMQAIGMDRFGDALRFGVRFVEAARFTPGD